MFAAFAERYQIWAAGARPLVGAAAREGGAREGRWGVEERREEGKEEGRKEVGSKGKVFKKIQYTSFSSWDGKGINEKDPCHYCIGFPWLG